jgi:hypothetical protein
MSWLSVAAFLGNHLLVLLALGATAWVTGRLALSRFPLDDGAERLAIPLVLGLAVLGVLVFALGLLGLLARGPLLALLIGVHLVGLEAWREIVRSGRAVLADRRRRAAAVGLIAASAPFFLLALYPPTAFDETLYHLPFAQGFARTGGVPFLPDLRFPLFPQLAEVLWAAVLTLSGLDTATHLVQWLAMGTTAVLLVAWGTRTFSPAAGWMAAALFLGYPIVLFLAVTGYVEAELALFVTAGLYSLQRWREDGGRGWLVMAAVFAGSAAGTKYHGLFFLAALAAELTVTAPRGRRGRSLLWFAVAAFVVSAPWYVRILIHTGNPVFPFLTRLFGAGEWDPQFLRMESVGMSGLLTLPWDVLFAREKLGHQPPFSPAFLLGLPLLVTAAFRDRRLRRLVLLAAVYALTVQVLPPDSRYFVVLLPALSLVAAAELARVRWVVRRPTLASVLCALFLLPSCAWAVYDFVRKGPHPVTAQERGRYLARSLPLWPAVDFLNRTRGSGYTVYGLHAENVRYFAAGRFIGEWSGPARYARLHPLLSDPPALWRELRRLGADHFLVVEGTGVHLPEDDPAFQRLFRKVYSDAASEVFALRTSSSIRPK